MSAGREPHISESRDLWTREHSRDRVVLTRFATPAPEPVRHRAEIAMLAWHGQEHRIASAAARRFLGIVGNGHAHVSAFAVCSAVAPDALSLIIFNARPDTGPRVLADLAIGDVQPVVASTLIPDDAVLHDDVTARIAAVDSVAFIQSIQPDQLVALGFTAPVLRDHALTGRILQHSFPGPIGAIELELRQVFAFDAAADPSADRILVNVQPSDRDDHPPWNICPVSLLLTDVVQRMDAQAAAHSSRMVHLLCSRMLLVLTLLLMQV